MIDVLQGAYFLIFSELTAEDISISSVGSIEHRHYSLQKRLSLITIMACPITLHPAVALLLAADCNYGLLDITLSTMVQFTMCWDHHTRHTSIFLTYIQRSIRFVLNLWFQFLSKVSFTVHSKYIVCCMWSCHIGCAPVRLLRYLLDDGISGRINTWLLGHKYWTWERISRCVQVFYSWNCLLF